jgi:PAS domain S-box-containing protein
MASRPPDSPPPPPPAAPARPSRVGPVVLFLVVAAAIVTAGAFSYLASAADLRRQAEREIATIALLKVREVVRWRDERLADGDAIAFDLAAELREGTDPATAVARLHEALRTHREYPALAVVDAQGALLATSGILVAEFSDPAMRAFARDAVRGEATALSPLHRHAADAALHLNVVAPIPPVPGRPQSAIVLRVDPHRQLFAMLQSWPRPSDLAETLLVALDGAEAVVLNELRDGTPALTLRFAPGAQRIPARAAAGARDVVEGVDHRGHAVLAAIEPVPNSPWTLVAELDAREALAPLRSLGIWTALLALALVLAVGASAALWWRTQLDAFERARAAGEAEAAEALRASEAKFRAAFEFASLGILIADPAGRIVETNRAMRRMLGYGDDEARGLTLRDVHEPDDDLSGRLLAEMAAGIRESVQMPRRFRHKDGTPIETILRATALRDDAGALRFALAVVEDVSEKKRLEARLVFADRMASVGTLAAGVAHEINNPLAFILGNVEFALGGVPPGADPELRRALRDALDGAVRVREIVRDLRTFSRPEDDRRVVLDPRGVLQSALGLAANEIRHRARLEVDPGDVPPVLASEHRLAQVFVNLLINAAQAIPEGRAEENVVRASTMRAPDGRALVEISDTGAGIPPDVLPRIFDPFFTTKPVGIGTGLGLSICHGIVTQLGGEIAVESVPGRGTTFRIHLPPAPAGAAVAAGPAAPGPEAARPGRVLVVDDEALVARAVERMLSPPHEVLTRGSARSALDLLEGDRDFDVILCDLMMPGMTGMDLHAALATRDPALARRMVFLTGGAFTDAARAFLEQVANPRLEKPVDRATLREAVARAVSPGVATPAA